MLVSPVTTLTHSVAISRLTSPFSRIPTQYSTTVKKGGAQTQFLMSQQIFTDDAIVLQLNDGLQLQ